MFRSCMKRSHQRFAGVWSIFLLLQQFKVVLLQNIQGTSSPYLQDASTVDNSWMPYYFSTPDYASIPEHGEEYGQWEEGGGEEESISNDTLNCWETIRNLTTSISAVVHQQQSETVSKINEWITSCNSTDEQQLYHFWKSQPFLSTLYTVLSAVLYSISDCPGMADNRLEEAVNEMGCELVSGLLDAMHMMMDNSSNISDETNATETESCLTEEALLLDDPMENELMEKKAEVLSESVVGMGEVLNLLKSLFETQVESERLELQAEIVKITDKIKKSMNSLEKTYEETLKGKDNAFQNGTRHHGSRLSKKSSKCLDPAKLKEASVPKLSNSSIRQVSRAKRSNSEVFQQYKDNSLKKVRRKRDIDFISPGFQNYTDKNATKNVHASLNSYAKAMTNQSAQQVFYFMKAADKCKLLTTDSKTNSTEEQDYDGKKIENHLWYWENGTTLKNKGNGQTVSLNSIDCKQIKFASQTFGLPSFPLGCVSNDGSTFAVNYHDCSMVFQTSQTSDHQSANSDRSIDNTTTPKWQLVSVKDKDAFKEVACPFFIKTNTFPCMLLTGGDEGDIVQTMPFDEDSMEKQLWYWNNQRLINVYSGLALEVSHDGPDQPSYITLGTPNNLEDKELLSQKWTTMENQIQSVMYPGLYLELSKHKTAENYAVHLSDKSELRWSFMDARNEGDILIVTTCVNVFYVKVKALPCKLLTVTEEGKAPELNTYNSDTILNQLWYWRGEHLANVATDLAFNIQTTENVTYSVILQLLNASMESQTWQTSKSLMKSEWTERCLFSINETSASYYLSVDCNPQNRSFSQQLEFINFNTGFNNIEKISCLYFIKSGHPACEFLTGFQDEHVVKMRPITEELMEAQLWYWDGPQLINVVSDLVLSVIKGNTSEESSLILVKSNKDKQNQSWKSANDKIIQVSWNTSAVTLNISNGHVALQPIGDGSFQSWEFIDSNEVSSNPDRLHCSDSSPQDRTYFFIRNKQLPCLLLTATSKGQSPVFIHYNTRTFEKQLWYWEQNHLINVDTGLALHIEQPNQSRESRVVLLPMFTFESSQKWVFEDGVFESMFDEECVLDTVKNDEEMHVLHIVCSGGRKVSQWEMIILNEISNRTEEVVCLFFIQNKHFPCEVLTGFAESQEVNLRPVTDELIDSQLWYWDGNYLINSNSGLSLGIVMNENNYVALVNITLQGNYTWAKDADYIQSDVLNNSVLTLDTINDGKVQVVGAYSDMIHSAYTVQNWTFLQKKDALHNSDVLYCKDIAEKVDLYFIKSSSQPCKLLTATAKGESPQFKHFDEDNIDMQLWYREGDQILNKALGLALHAHQELKDVSVILWDSFAFATSQKWDIHSSTLKSKKYNHCALTVENGARNPDELTMTCKKHVHQHKQHWEFVDYTIATKNLDAVACFYFIRNGHESCEYLTGFSEGQQVKLRPVIKELYKNQLWYWNGAYLTHMKSDLVLGKKNTSINAILQNKHSGYTNPNAQMFLYDDNKFLSSFDDKKVLDINIDDDGNIYFNRLSSGVSQHWTFIEMTWGLENEHQLSCAPIKQDPTLFFIKNFNKPCELLSAIGKGESPQFKHFDSENLHLQLWYWDSFHLVNIGTGLSLQVQGKTKNVVLWPVYAFGNGQKWQQNENKIGLVKKPDCLLDTSTDGGEVTLNANCAASGNSSTWEMVEFDDELSNRNRLQCTYFIKNGLQPCELLTGFSKGESVKLRPQSEEFIMSQLWYWDGKHLINDGNHLALRVDTQGLNVILSTQINAFKSQMWERDSLYLKSQGKDGHVMDPNGVNVGFSIPDNSDRQKWHFIRSEVGLKNPSLLHCQPDRDGLERYFVKIEQHPCHLMTQIECGEVNLHAYNEEKVQDQLWLQEGAHILNANNYLALSIKNPKIPNALSVSLKTKYSYEHYQMWERHEHLIKSQFKDASLALGYYIDSLQMHEIDSTDAQKWTWLLLKDVIADNKLLRCSRCYDKAEEKAAMVMGFIPVVSLFYNLIRAAVYAGKGCNDVAIESLQGAAIDIAMDLGILVTGGALSAVAYGAKTGFKFGVKAGVKAIGKAIRASVKLPVLAMKMKMKIAIQQGIKTTIKKSIGQTIKTAYLTAKNTVKLIKQVSLKTGKVLKQIPQKSVKIGKTLKKQIKDVSGSKMFKKTKKLLNVKNFKRTGIIAGQNVKKTSKKMAGKLKEMGNKLASKAEKQVKRLDDIEHGKVKSTKIRCKRMLVHCPTGFSTDPEIKNKFSRIKAQGKIDFPEVQNSRQHVYLYIENKDDELVKVFGTDISTSKKQNLHTEQALDNNALEILKRQENTKKTVYWYSLNTPCQTPTKNNQQKPCFQFIIDTCKEWYNSQRMKCVVGFDKWYATQDKSLKQDMYKIYTSPDQNTNAKLVDFQRDYIKTMDDNLKQGIPLYTENIVSGFVDKNKSKLKSILKQTKVKDTDILWERLKVFCRDHLAKLNIISQAKCNLVQDLKQEITEKMLEDYMPDYLEQTLGLQKVKQTRTLIKTNEEALEKGRMLMNNPDNVFQRAFIDEWNKSIWRNTVEESFDKIINKNLYEQFLKTQDQNTFSDFLKFVNLTE